MSNEVEVIFLNIPYDSVSYECNLICRSRYMDTELNSISHVRASIEVIDTLRSKKSVGINNLCVIISQKYGSQDVHFFYNHLKFI